MVRGRKSGLERAKAAAFVSEKERSKESIEGSAEDRKSLKESDFSDLVTTA